METEQEQSHFVVRVEGNRFRRAVLTTQFETPERPHFHSLLGNTPQLAAKTLS